MTSKKSTIIEMLFKLKTLFAYNVSVKSYNRLELIEAVAIRY